MSRQKNYHIRPARLEEKPALLELIALSARGLSRDDYTDEEIESAITYIFGVDSDLVADGTYFVVEQGGEILACGGWSKRRTLFGGDQFAKRDSGFLDPAIEPAKIRAFFVHPSHARKGIGTALLRHCEVEAKKHGFSSIEMMATLPGVKFYREFGYHGEEESIHVTPDGLHHRCLPMRKIL